MKINVKPENFEKLQQDNVIIGFVSGKAIIETEDKELHYIEGMTLEHAVIGEVVADETFKSIRLLPSEEQVRILKMNHDYGLEE